MIDTYLVPYKWRCREFLQSTVFVNKRLPLGNMEKEGLVETSNGVTAEEIENETLKKFEQCTVAFPSGFVRIKPYNQVDKL